MTVWPSIVDALARLGVDHVFGVPGIQTVEAFEALRKRGLRVTLPTSELAGSFMAGGYSRATGRVGVLFTIGGPGFTYALPGIAEARLDSAGLLHVMNAPAESPGRRFQLQAIDQKAISAPLTKGDFRLGPDDDVFEVVSAAYELAGSGEPGPVTLQVASTPRSSDGKVGETVGASVGVSERSLEGLVAWYERARRPLFLLGQGAIGSAETLRHIVDVRRIPVLTTVSGRGVIDERHPMAMGFDSLRGHVDAANALVEEADLVVVLGAKLGHNGTAGFGIRLSQDRLVHVDLDSEVPGANYATAMSLICDVSAVASRLAGASVAAHATEWDPGALDAFRTDMREVSSAGEEPRLGGGADPGPAAFFGWLRALLPDDTILVTDTGLHQILTRRHFEVRAPRGLVVPSDFQSMGFGLPGAIGAAVGSTGRPVAALIGDGGFLISAMELVTAVRDRIPLLLIVFVDGQLNQIRLQQLRDHGHAHAVSLGHVDYGSFAKALGVRHVVYGHHDDGALRAALRDPPPVLLEVPVDDSWSIRATGLERRLKSGLRDLVGPDLTNWIKERVRP